MVSDRKRLSDKRFGSGFVFACIALAALSLCPATAVAQESAAPAATDTLAPLAPPTNVQVADTQNDRGSQIDISWDQSPDAEDGLVQYYRIYRSSHPDTGFVAVGRVGFAQSNYTDAGMPDNQEFYYRVASAGYDERLAYSGTVGPVSSHPQWFNRDRLNVMIAVIIFVTAIVYFVRSARGGKELFIRRLPGLDEIDNAVGRATEMGKPILYISGLSTVSDVATIAAINILGEVAKKTAEYNTRLIVPCADPIVMAVEQEVVKEAYAEVGRPDAYNEDDVFYLTRSQFAYVAGVNGIMVRQRPATILYMGMFYAESLVLAETGASVGSIQIAGTDAVTQLPFFITSCDYTLIGEELYA
ncbi:MAG: fibronectin type III domain-containing protein, partial [Candidatus Eisenbacteria bacterium]|nr:fibronectin type III domain-containing protein [Candidatus Eisenbacteria bacterium]